MMNRRILTRSLLIASLPVALLLTGCHIILGPEEGEQDWWYYCNEAHCYRCNVDYCEIEGSDCMVEGCPPNMFCDPGSRTCKSKSGCKTSKECGEESVCIGGRCVPDRGPCKDDAACGAGAYCSNGTCVDTGLCSKDGDCAKYGKGFVCDSRGTCVPGPPTQSCSDGKSCPGGLCVDATCGSCAGTCGGGKSCQLNAHCGTGRVCLDAKCTNSCSKDSDCGTAQRCKSKVCVPGTGSCVKNTDCGSGKLCVNKTCHQDCTTSGKCSNSFDVCSSGVVTGDIAVKFCFADTAAKPECKVTGDCSGGELCVDGVCRTSCVKTEDCAACDDGPVCGPGGFCMTSAEANPKCKVSAECDSGKSCLNAQCVTL
jgi:hypothetical protein